MAFFERARALLPAGDDPTLARRQVEIAVGWTRAAWLSVPVQDSLAVIGAALPLAEALGDRRLLGEVYIGAAILHWRAGEPYEDGTIFKRDLDRVLAIAAATDNPGLRGLALSILGRSSLLSASPARAIEVLEEAIPLTSGSDYIGSSMAANSLAMAYAKMGEFAKAATAVARAKELAERRYERMKERLGRQRGAKVARRRSDLAPSSRRTNRSARQAPPSVWSLDDPP